MTTDQQPSFEHAKELFDQGGQAYQAQQFGVACVFWQLAIQEFQALISQGHEHLRVDVANIQMSIGVALASSGKLDEALGCYSAALGEYQALIAQGHEHLRVNVAKTQVNMGVALQSGGKIDEALVCFDAAQGEYQTLIAQGHEHLRVNVAMTQMNMGEVLQSGGKLDEALVCYGAALREYQTLITQGHEHLRADAAMTQMNMGVALLSGGKLDEAMGCYSAALGDYQALIAQGHEHLRANLANIQVNMGGALQSGGKFEDALVCYGAAQGEYQTLIAQGHEHLRVNLANIQVNMGVALASAGKLDEALGCHGAALREYQALIAQGHEHLRVNVAMTQMNKGGDLASAGKLDEALGCHSAALREFQALIAQGHEHLRADAAKTQMNMGVALASGGKLDEALGCHGAALREYQALIAQGHEHLRADAAMTQMNLGMALASGGKLDEALGCHGAALREYQTLIAQGHEHLRIDVAKTQVNMGVALQSGGKLDEALVCYGAAQGEYQTLIARGHEHLHANLANIQMNMGGALQSGGKFEDALVCYGAALREYQSLIAQGHEHLRFDVANTQMNLGMALASGGKLDEALDCHGAALREYQSLIAQGHEHLRVGVANTQMNMGMILEFAGKLDKALGCYGAALGEYRELVQSGQWQHMPRLFNAHAALVGMALKMLTEQRTEGGEMKIPLQWLENMQKTLSLLNAVETDLYKFDDPRADLVRLATLRSVLHSVSEWDDARSSWPEGDGRLGIDRAALGVLAAWLQRMRKLLTEGSPAFVVNQFETGIAPLQRQVLGWLREWGSTEQVASWHLHTQGLRAQRQALLQGMENDPELADLVALYQQLDNLAHQVLGGGLTQAEPELAPGRPALGGVQEADHRSGRGVQAGHMISQQGQVQETPMTRYDMLYAKLAPMVTRLKREGKLPEDAGLFLSTATARNTLRELQTQQQTTALLLLMPVLTEGGSSMLAVSLGHEATLDRMWVLAVPDDILQTVRTAWQRLSADAVARAKGSRGSEGGGDLVASRWRGVVASSRPNIALPLVAKPKDAAKSASVHLLSAKDRHELLHHVCLNTAKVLMPALQALHNQGVQAVHVVPAGEWHAVPWAAELDQAIAGLTVRQFPTAAGWNNAIKAQCANSNATRWASLTYDAAGISQSELLWVGAEQAALQRLWQPEEAGMVQTLVQVSPHQPVWPNAAPADGTAGIPVSTGFEAAEADQVNGLVCIGHGDTPGGNLSLAGMLLPADKHAQQDVKANKPFQFFTAMSLHQIRHAHRLVMSCCVLGRIGDAHGEPIGMTALAFAFKTRFGVGAMLPIPDLEGALFSMALHYAWSRAELIRTISGQSADWAGVFHTVRRKAMSGQWPDGFGEWLVSVWWPLVEKLNDTLANKRGYWLENADARGAKVLVRGWAQTPSVAVKQVAAVMVCLG